MQEASQRVIQRKFSPDQELKPFLRTFRRSDGVGVPMLLLDRRLVDKKGQVIGLRTAMTAAMVVLVAVVMAFVADPVFAQTPFPDCNLDLTATIEVMREHGADIIGVQEVDRFWARSSYLDEPAELAAGVGMDHYCYAANLDHVPDSHSNVPHQYGTVILSRFPILECGNTLLRRTGTNEQRGLTRALINVRGVPLQFYNTHLHTTAVDRLLQTADIAGVIDAAPEGSKILMGDFNARPTTVEMQPIYSRFVDSWLEAPAPTAENPSGFTSPARLSSNPTSRIDYVFVSPDVKVSLAYVPIDAKTRFASDHYPVVSDVALPGSAVGIRRKEPARPGAVEGEDAAEVEPEDEAGAPPPM